MAETAMLSATFEVSIPKSVRDAHRWQAGQEFAVIPKGSGILFVPVPERDALAGIAEGAATGDHRDRSDRF